MKTVFARCNEESGFGRPASIMLVLGAVLTATIFAVYSPFFRALPPSDSERIVRFWRMDGDDRFRDFSSRELDALLAKGSSFDAVAGISFLRRDRRGAGSRRRRSRDFEQKR